MLIDFRTKDGKQGLFDRWNINPKGVLHIGANRGEEAPVYNELKIGKVVWVEANAKIYQDLLHTLTQYPNQHSWFFAAGDENKLVDLHISNNAGQSSSVLELGTHLTAHPEVHYTHDQQVMMYRIDEFQFEGDANLEGLDFLNIDIQGFELNALRGMGDKLHQFKWAYLEVNNVEVYKGCGLVEDIDFYLAAYGFRRVETYNRGGHFDRLGWSDALYVKN